MFARHEHIQTRSRFEGGTSRDVEKPGSIHDRPLAVTFGDVQRDRGARLVEMPQRTRLGIAFSFIDEGTNPSDEIDREPIDIEPFMIELRSAHVVGIGPCLGRLREYEYEYEHDSRGRTPTCR